MKPFIHPGCQHHQTPEPHCEECSMNAPKKRHKITTAEVVLPYYPTTPNIPHGTALMVWVVDRWNQGEYEDFKKDELVDTQQNHTCYLSAEAAMKDVEDDVRNEMDENREHESEPDMIEELQTKDWKMEWKKPEKGKDGTKTYTSEDTWDGSMYTVRAIPLYLKTV